MKRIYFYSHSQDILENKSKTHYNIIDRVWNNVMKRVWNWYQIKLEIRSHSKQNNKGHKAPKYALRSKVQPTPKLQHSHQHHPDDHQGFSTSVHTNLLVIIAKEKITQENIHKQKVS